jgi:hypothetical protein
MTKLSDAGLWSQLHRARATRRHATGENDIELGGELKASGVLTEAEFEAQKAKVLAG